MSLVKLNIKGQVTLPSSLRERAGLDAGDLLEVKLEKGKITLTPQSLVDQHLEEGLEDIRKGRTYGPFNTADDMIASMRSNIKARSRARRSKHLR